MFVSCWNNNITIIRVRIQGNEPLYQDYYLSLFWNTREILKKDLKKDRSCCPRELKNLPQNRLQINSQDSATWLTYTYRKKWGETKGSFQTMYIFSEGTVDKLKKTKTSISPSHLTSIGCFKIPYKCFLMYFSIQVSYIIVLC